MGLIHEFDYTCTMLNDKHVNTIESFGLVILRYEVTNDGKIAVLIKGTFDQHQRIKEDFALVRIFDLI